MKKLGFILAGTVAFAVVAAPLSAQDTTRRDTTRRASPGAVAKMPTFRGLIAAINNASETATKVEGLTTLEASKVRIVDTKQLVTPAEQADFTATIEKNAAALDGLRTALGKNQVITKSLADHSPRLTLADVVGVEVMDDGDVFVYVKPAQ
jgi:hypothetical protein